MDKKAGKKNTTTKDVKVDSRSKSKSPKKVKEEKDKSSKQQTGPKRAMTAYFYYLAAVREELTKKGFKGKEVSSEAAKMWKELQPNEKSKYEDMNAKDKIRYEKEKKDFEEKGYFINQDGEKIVKNKEDKKADKVKKKDDNGKKDIKQKTKKNDKKKKGADTGSESEDDD